LLFSSETSFPVSNSQTPFVTVQGEEIEYCWHLEPFHEHFVFSVFKSSFSSQSDSVKSPQTLSIGWQIVFSSFVKWHIFFTSFKSEPSLQSKLVSNSHFESTW